MKKLLIILLIVFVIIVLLSLKPKMDQRDKNRKAFLKVIQFTEGTAKSINPYAVVFGFGYTIKDFSDHPSNLGTWTGKTLNDNICLRANQNTGCKSTASGAYQFLKSTWNGIKEAIPGIKFNATGQDMAALYLIKKRGAIDDIDNGRFYDAIAKCSKEWASFPGSPYGQPTKKIEEIVKVFTDNGGKIV